MWNVERWLNRVLPSVVICALAGGACLAFGADLSRPLPDRRAEKAGSGPVRYVIKDGLAQGKLYVPERSGRALLFAAQELREHLEKITGADVPMAWRQARPGDSGFVFVIRPEGEWKGKESAQAFVIEETNTPAALVTITGNTSLGVLYGVYQYLSDLGVRWLAPGEIGANIPRSADVPVRPGRRAASPSFGSRILTLSSVAQNHFGGTADIAGAVNDYELYMIRNRTHLGSNRFAAKDFGFAVDASLSGHAVKPMTGLSSQKVKEGLMDKEPERFALVTGTDLVQKRRYDDGQVCFSNEKNIEMAISNCIAFYADLERTKDERNSDLDEECTVSMSLSDCFGICECEPCRKIAGTGPNSKDRLVWSFWNRVARGLNEKMPGRMMMVSANYLDLTQPPDDVVSESNIVVCTPLVYAWEKAPENRESYPFPRQFLQSVLKVRQAGVRELNSYNYLNFPWSPTPLLIFDAAEGYAKLGYRQYHLEAMQRTEYAWPIVWALAQYTWNSSKAPREYLKEFCLDYYGAPYDADVLWFFEEMTKNACTMDRINFGGGADTSAMLTDGLIKDARSRLRNAVRHAQGLQQERLSRLNDSLEAQFQLAETYRAYCKALNSRAAVDIGEFEKRARGLQAFWSAHNLNMINTTTRSPAEAAALYLKTDFANLKPASRKELEGKGPQDERWMRELFAGSAPPERVPNLFPLPEVWMFHIDWENTGIQDGCFKAEYDDSKDWQPLSSWACPSSQGYNSQIGGAYWYRVRFRAPAFPVGKKVFLRIGSLDDTGDVYLNGVHVGSQPEPRDWDRSFALDVTDAVKRGEDNVLAVRGYDSGGGEGVWRPSALYTE